MDLVKGAQEEQKRNKDESGVKFGEMSQMHENKELLFPFEKLINTRQDVWINL